MEDDDKVFIQEPMVSWTYAKASARMKVATAGQKSEDFGIVLLTLDIPNQTMTYVANNYPATIHLPFKGLTKAQLDLSHKRPIFILYFPKKMVTLQFVRFKEWAVMAEMMKSLKNIRTSERPFMANDHYQKIANQYLYDESQVTAVGDTMMTDSVYDFDDDFSPKVIQESSSNLDIENIELSTQ